MSKFSWHSFVGIPQKQHSTLLTVHVQCCANRFSHGQLFVTPWTIAHQAPLSMGFCRQEDQRGLPFPFPGDHPNPGIEPTASALQVDSLPMSHQSRQIWPATCFCKSPEPRMAFTFLNCWKESKNNISWYLKILWIHISVSTSNVYGDTSMSTSLLGCFPATMTEK